MVKHTQTIRRIFQTNCLSVFDHFAGSALKGLIVEVKLGDNLQSISILKQSHIAILSKTKTKNSKKQLISQTTH